MGLTEAEMWTTIGLVTMATVLSYLVTGVWEMLLVPVMLVIVFAVANQTRDEDRDR